MYQLYPDIKKRSLLWRIQFQCQFQFQFNHSFNLIPYIFISFISFSHDYQFISLESLNCLQLFLKSPHAHCGCIATYAESLGCWVHTRACAHTFEDTLSNIGSSQESSAECWVYAPSFIIILLQPPPLPLFFSESWDTIDRLSLFCQLIQSVDILIWNKMDLQDQIKVSLEESQLWEKFAVLTNEMIVTKNGRRMFPVIKLNLSGLEPNTLYKVWLEFRQIENNRYKYINGEWHPGNYKSFIF